MSERNPGVRRLTEEKEDGEIKSEVDIKSGGSDASFLPTATLSMRSLERPL